MSEGPSVPAYWHTSTDTSEAPASRAIAAAASVVAMANRVMPWSTRASAMASDQPAISA
jgi:hypothetical protein